MAGDLLGFFVLSLLCGRLIVAIDAGCDPFRNFDDLGNAIRKIRIDFGVTPWAAFHSSCILRLRSVSPIASVIASLIRSAYMTTLPFTLRAARPIPFR